MISRPRKDTVSEVVDWAGQNKMGVLLDVVANYFSADVYGYRPGRIERETRDLYLTIIEKADAVTCSSSYLAEILSGLHPKVFYVPDAVNTRHFSPQFLLEQKQFDLVWVGVSDKVTDIIPYCDVLKRLKKSLLVVTDKPRRVANTLQRFDLTGLTIKKWRYASVPRQMSRARVAISPRNPDLEYSKSVSNFKVVSAMALGLPVVASPIPSYGEALEIGGGVICEDSKSWEAEIENLLNNETEWKNVSSLAIEAASRFSLEKIADQLAEILLLTLGENRSS